MLLVTPIQFVLEMSLLIIPVFRSNFHDRIEGAAGMISSPVFTEQHMVNSTGSEASHSGFVPGPTTCQQEPVQVVHPPCVLVSSSLQTIRS